MEVQPVDNKPEWRRNAFLEVYVELSQVPEDILSKLEQKQNVIIHDTTDSWKQAIYSWGVISYLNKGDICLVITSHRSFEFKIFKTLEHLGGVKVRGCGTILDLEFTKFDVAVGRPDNAFSLLEDCIGIKARIKSVVFDWGNELIEDEDETGMLDVITRIIEEVGNEVQVVVCVEQELKESTLSFLQKMLKVTYEFSSGLNKSSLSSPPRKVLKVTDEFSSRAPTAKKLILPYQTTKHQYIFVEECFNKRDYLCDFVCDVRESMGNTIISCSNIYSINGVFEKLQVKNIPVSVIKSNAYTTKKEIENTAKEFLDDTHLLILNAITVCDMNNLISDKVDCVIHCHVWCPPRSYLKHLYPFKGLSNSITFLRRKEASLLVDIQERFGIVFEKFRRNPSDILSTQTQKQAVGRHIVCKMPELEQFLVPLLKKAEVSVIFVKVVSEMSTQLKKLGLYPTCRTQHREIKNVESSQPLVYVVAGDKDDINYISAQQKVSMVINYDMPSEVETYYNRVSWCNDKVIIINLTTAVDWPRLLDWQIELGVRFERFCPPNVLSHLEDKVRLMWLD